MEIKKLYLITELFFYLNYVNKKCSLSGFQKRVIYLLSEIWDTIKKTNRDIRYICKVCKASGNTKQIRKIDNASCLNVQLETNSQIGKEETETATSNIKVLKQSPVKLTAAETLLIEEKTDVSHAVKQ